MATIPFPFAAPPQPPYSFSYSDTSVKFGSAGTSTTEVISGTLATLLFLTPVYRLGKAKPNADVQMSSQKGPRMGPPKGPMFVAHGY